MSIFREYGGPSSERGYYSAADWEKLQNPSWAKNQSQYDAFAAQAAARAESRAEAMSRAREAIPYSYTQFGRGSTEPVFSLAGFSGHTSGGTAGLGGFGGTGSPTGTTTKTSGTPSEDSTPVDPVPVDPVPENENFIETDPYFEERAEGGVILPVQHMQEGGMIQSPYANPMNSSIEQAQKSALATSTPAPAPAPQLATQQMPSPMTGPVQQAQPLVSTMAFGEEAGSMPPSNSMQQPGVGGLFHQIHNQFNQQMGQMQAQPLRVYQNYLMETYAQPEMQQQQQKVDHFLDLVDQAERAHFGAEQSFGFGGGPMMQQYQQALPAPRMSGAGIASLGASLAGMLG